MTVFKVPDSGDQDNYETTKAHVQILRESRDRARREYDTARAAWGTFKKNASLWAEYTNRIHRSEEEDKLVEEVLLLKPH